MTGGSGFIGSRLLPLLDDHDVLVLSRHAPFAPPRPRVRTIAADLTTTGSWCDEIVAFQPECCLHLAWQGLPDYSLDCCRRNVDVGLRLFGVLTDAQVQKVVVAGSCWEYGRASGAVSEDREPVDVGVFAAAKHALLTMLGSVARERGFDYVWARLFFVYGPGQRSTSLIPHLHASFAAHCPPDVRRPQARQDFVYVDDAAAALVALAISDVKSGIFNVGTGTPTSVAYVANSVAARYGIPRPFAGDDDGDGFWAETTKIASMTGWRARVGIDEGIEMTLGALDRAI